MLNMFRRQLMSWTSREVVEDSFLRSVGIRIKWKKLIERQMS